MIRYVPNTLTVSRLLALPVFVWLYGMQAPGVAWKAAILMWCAGWTDFFDGYIARKYNAGSEFGRILDPFVDRAYFLTVFITYIAFGTMPWWAAAPVIGRDVLLLIVSALLFRTAKEKPRVLPLGRYATMILAAGGFMLDLRPEAWTLYVIGGGLYLYVGVLYGVRWAKERRAGPAAPVDTA